MFIHVLGHARDWARIGIFVVKGNRSEFLGLGSNNVNVNVIV